MHLYLIGYRGSGKSTVGRLVAARLGRPIIDTDEVIERESGMTIKEIFEAESEQGFRDRETEALRAVALRSSQPCVVSLGGGAILREENQQLILASGHCVWLQGTPELLHQRILSDQTTQSRRPNLSQRGGFEEVADVLRVRTPIYQRLAEKTVAIDCRPPDELANEIVDWANSAVPSD
jgi:shikimate kinase